MIWWSAERRGLAILAAISTALMLLGMLFLDGPIAQWAAVAVPEESLWSSGTTFLDTVTGKNISKFLVGFALLGAGGIALLVVRWRVAGRMALYVGSVQVLTTLLAGVLKDPFGRMRPFQTVVNGQWSDVWFAGGSSFPSGHTAYYAGLFLPLILLFPRWVWLWAIVPLFIVAARILAHDHYMSDVTASLALCAILSLVLSMIPPHNRRLITPDGEGGNAKGAEPGHA